MRRIGLRPRKKTPTLIDKAYAQEVRRQRKLGNMKSGEYDPHHLAGRGKYNLLFFVMIPRALHSHIHQHPAWARENGWLANVNGSFSMDRDPVLRARQRQQELIAQLENNSVIGT